MKSNVLLSAWQRFSLSSRRQPLNIKTNQTKPCSNHRSPHITKTLTNGERKIRGICRTPTHSHIRIRLTEKKMYLWVHESARLVVRTLLILLLSNLAHYNHHHHCCHCHCHCRRLCQQQRELQFSCDFSLLITTKGTKLNVTPVCVLCVCVCEWLCGWTNELCVSLAVCVCMCFPVSLKRIFHYLLLWFSYRCVCVCVLFIHPWTRVWVCPCYTFQGVVLYIVYFFSKE